MNNKQHEQWIQWWRTVLFYDWRPQGSQVSLFMRRMLRGCDPPSTIGCRKCEATGVLYSVADEDNYDDIFCGDCFHGYLPQKSWSLVEEKTRQDFWRWMNNPGSPCRHHAIYTGTIEWFAYERPDLCPNCKMEG